MSQVGKRTWWHILRGANFVFMKDARVRAMEACTEIPESCRGQTMCGRVKLSKELKRPLYEAMVTRLKLQWRHTRTSESWVYLLFTKEVWCTEYSQSKREAVCFT